LRGVDVGTDKVWCTNYAFVSCFGLTSVALPDSLIHIDEYAFCGCTLTSVALPNSLVHIEEGAFDDRVVFTSAPIICGASGAQH
jgi:hypothetical protein